MWIDSHCHLNHEKFDGEPPEQIITRALENGVQAMVNISCQIKGDFPQVLKTAQAHESVYCTIGTHPHDAGDEAEKAVSLKHIVEIASAEDKVIGIGESGLDYYYDNAPRGDQAESFRKHIKACIQTGLPLIVHTRDAEEETVAIMREGLEDGSYGAVMHCFSGTKWLAEQALDMGFYLSFSGIVTFKKATELQEIAAWAPADRILVETDAPYLAPVPYRGKTNYPSYVTNTGEFIAQLRYEDVKTFSNQICDNFYTLFAKART